MRAFTTAGPHKATRKQAKQPPAESYRWDLMSSWEGNKSSQEMFELFAKSSSGIPGSSGIHCGFVQTSKSDDFLAVEQQRVVFGV